MFRYIDGLFAKIIIYFISKMRTKGSRPVLNHGKVKETSGEDFQVRSGRRFGRFKVIFADADHEMKIGFFDGVVGFEVSVGEGDFHLATHMSPNPIVKFHGACFARSSSNFLMQVAGRIAGILDMCVGSGPVSTLTRFFLSFPQCGGLRCLWLRIV